MSLLKFIKAHGTIRVGTVHQAAPSDAVHYIRKGLAVLHEPDDAVLERLHELGWKPGKEPSEQAPKKPSKKAAKEPQKQPEREPEPNPEGTPLPDDYPAHDELLSAGYTTLEAVAEATDDELTAIDGIGPATLTKIRDQ